VGGNVLEVRTARRRGRKWAIAAALVLLVCAGAAIAALLVWPSVRLDSSPDALARVVAPRFAGRVEAVSVRSANKRSVPVQQRQGGLFPTGKLKAGERLQVRVTVRRPDWAGWLVGHTKTRTFTVVTPVAHLSNRWLQVKPGTPVTVLFDSPVSVVVFGHGHPRPLASPQRGVPVGIAAIGTHTQGAIDVAAAARSWERLSPAQRVSWFPAKPFIQLLAAPKPGVAIAPGRQLRLTFSDTVQDVLGAARPQLFPATPGRWRLIDPHTLVFQPTALGFPVGSKVRVVLPAPVRLAGQRGSVKPTTTLHWSVPLGSTLRLQELLAQLGYLPVEWYADDPALSTARSQLTAVVLPPKGQFVWRYPNTPPELQAQWKPGEWNSITRGAVMMFESTHDLAVDGLPGPKVWRALVGDALAGKRDTRGYNYVFVHRNVPQSMNLWHNGRVILSSPGNTGVPAAPTALGTFAVFEHVPVGTMAGTNPDGSHYNDPGIRWISYFHHGEALHSFNRASFGTPQSLGCVELPLAAAAKVWPYTTIGTLVTIEN
jgi:L,D-transpeptidase catalytic domain